MNERWISFSHETFILASISSASRIAAVSLGIVAALIAVVLYIASRTRWGQNKPLTKCITLALLAHVWLLMFAYGTRVQRPGHGPGNAAYTTDPISFVEFGMEASRESDLQAPSTLEPAMEPPTTLDVPQESTSTRDMPEAIAEHPVDRVATSQDQTRDNSLADAHKQAQGIEATISNLPSAIETQQGLDHAETPPWQITSKSELQSMQMVGKTPVRVPARRRVADQQMVPEIYQLRFSESRSQIAGQLGGDASTEASVEAALRWLASIQEPDGSWDAAKYGAGRETRTQDHDRQGTGSKSDTGMAALALLSFLGAGYTHEQGPYTQVIASGLGYLLSAQMPSGDLAGPKQIGSGGDVRYARMYCHGMATLALAEAYAMTGDRRLLDPIQKAAGYTLPAQNPQSGGWRYQSQLAGDPGDLSQFGWQAMALISCEHANVKLPTETHARMENFLDSVASGRNGGLAVYRPVPGQRPTSAMTAEALALRALLNHPLHPAAQQEATTYLLQYLPGRSEENFYYWYYATLALFQQQDEAWQVWNNAMKAHLTSTQVMSGTAAGSWDPRCIWAGYGGRIYSTSLACLCLEVYYRYLPIYHNSRMANQPNTGWR